MQLLFPTDPLNEKVVDEPFTAEFDAARAAGFSASLFSFENFVREDFRPRPALQAGEQVLYRGWMLTAPEYSKLIAALGSANAQAVTSLDAYQLCHHLPCWYPFVSDLTAETIMLAENSDFVAELAACDWPGYFIKDYVKSLNTSGGSLVSNPADIARVVALMKKYRGFVEGGVCVRRREDYVPGSERRFFVRNARVFAAVGDIPPIVHDCAARIDSPFFSIDIARRTDGVLRIIEIGYGQVSGRKEWSAERLAEMFGNE